MTQPAPEIAKQVILVVDDDEAVRDSLRNMMKSEGFEVRTFSNGRDLLNEASLPAIGCLVVDYHMHWSARCAVGEFRSRLFSSQEIQPNMCATEPQQLRFWSSRNRR
jgi:FixJ family two-component response regulator